MKVPRRFIILSSLICFFFGIFFASGASALAPVSSGSANVYFVDGYSANSFSFSYSQLPTAFLFSAPSGTIREVTTLDVIPNLGTISPSQNSILVVDVQLYQSSWSISNASYWNNFTQSSTFSSWVNDDSSQVTNCSLTDVSTFLSAVIHCELSLSPGRYEKVTIRASSPDPIFGFVGYQNGVSTNALINFVSFELSAGGSGTLNPGSSSPNYTNEFNQVNNNLTNIDNSINQTNQILQDQQNQAQQDKDQYQQGSDASQADIDASQADVDNASANLLQVIGSFVQALHNAQPTNCKLNLDYAPFSSNNNFGLKIDLCALEMPPALSTLLSLVVIVALAALAFHLIKQFIAIFWGFQ